ncbi:lesion bypass phage DNA polymerase [Alkalihalophilus pseudofirmus OF4]|jgi:DNA polymerase V|uniref:Lesion bypass phage DNA polymerase n=1 Tax=Alkalihalophilus pseudofirmus (strain ATCC BAA-2126 / JCM 17055 / OF4) TaxID=398511 RepID=D3FS32_ALKPO|nr:MULTISPECIES: UV-damage repair protein uvrX [Alkalihalophilus]ADC51667.1 lesion bypass phage DNA polymerase [Alkalihalophilus pseudofirmus OF4]MCM3490161.1 UV damage repair protein UvrX [Alkalihalophilus marmarensis]MED1600421.1 UV damage repair protein UvrX [Alkalihalophilus marmarensis]
MFNYEAFPKQSYLCCDLKSFYASVSAVKLGLHPFVTKLAVVGDTKRNGSVVLAATPKLKEMGIKTGSRLFEIPKDPDIVVVNAEMEEFLKISTEITLHMEQYVPPEDIFVYSIDEAFIKLTSKLHQGRENQREFARMLQQSIKSCFGLTLAVGSSSCNMLLSKVALDIEAKKQEDHFAHWDYEDVETKLWRIQPLSDMWGIGRRYEKTLMNMGIRSVAQLANSSLKRLEFKFGKVMGQQLYQHAWGIDVSDIHKPAKIKSKSYSVGQILLRDYVGTEEIKTVILEMCEEVVRRARKKRAAGRTISLGLGYSKNEGGGGFSRQLTVDEPTNSTLDIYNACLKLLNKHYHGETVRQVYVALSKVQPDTERQLSLFVDEEEVTRKRELGYVMDSIREKYGATAILRASSYTKGGTTRHRSGLIAGHKK